MKLHLERKLADGIDCKEPLAVRITLIIYGASITIYFLSFGWNWIYSPLVLVTCLMIISTVVFHSMPDFSVWDKGLSIRVRNIETFVVWDDISSVHRTSINTRIEFKKTLTQNRLVNFFLATSFVFMFWRPNYYDAVEVIEYKVGDKFHQTV